MQITAQTLAEIAGRPVNSNMQSTILGLQMAGIGAGLERPTRLAMYLGQLAHESMGWHYDREVWGPTKAQAGYEGRRDLGNIYPGDGSKFRARGPIQITGRYNYSRFTVWARKMSGDAPDFTIQPDAVNTDPWEGLSPIWYWDSGNPTGQSLNFSADAADYEAVTRRINGGLNGYTDRQARYGRAALVLLGRDPGDMREFQRSAGLAADGDVGPRTISALHVRLASLAPVTFSAPGYDRPSPKPVRTSFWAILARIFGVKA